MITSYKVTVALHSSDFRAFPVVSQDFDVTASWLYIV